MTLILYSLVGIIAGLISGLFGVGGGVVIVPFLVLMFSLQGMSAEVLTHVAVGTSFACIVVNAAISTWTHHKKSAVLWRVFVALTPGICIGVFLGVQLAKQLSGDALQLLIAAFLFLIGIRMSLQLQPKPSRSLPTNTGLFFVGGTIGSISALFGIGGGSLTVPFLRWCNTVMQKAVATSAACGLPIAIVGAVSNIYSGWQTQDLPSYATGFVYWPAALGIVLLSAPFAKVGAHIAHRLDARKLQKIFAAFMLITAVVMLINSLR